MKEQIDLKALEKKAWKSFFDDGLWDIYLGSLLALMGISGALDNTALSEDQIMMVYLGLMMFVMLAFWAGKRYIVVPRIGQAKFKKQKRRKVSVILILSVVVGLVAWWFTAGMGDVSPEQRTSFKEIFPLVYALNNIIVFSAIAYFTSFERLYYIGILFALPVPIDQWLYDSYNINLDYIAFIVPALLIVTVGIVYFVRFLKNYPRVPEMA